MKKYTLEDFKNFDKDEYGRIICPSGDYSGIKVFPEWCRFGEGCSFGEGGSFGRWCRFGESCYFGEWCHFGGTCSFGESCSFFSKEIKENGLILIVGIGSEKRTTQVFLLKEGGVLISCGCQQGITLDVFKERIKKTHAEGTKHRKEYDAVLMLIEAQL